MASVLSIAAHGVTPTSAEIKTARALYDNFFTKGANPPISFKLDGLALDSIIKGFQTKLVTRELKDHSETVITIDDPASKLQVRCIATYYNGSSAFEWVAFLENKGVQPTPLISNVVALDRTFLTGKSPILQQSLGDDNSENSFRPVDLPINIDDKITMSPSMGRSSEPYLPFLNLITHSDEGLAIGIGWSGQWQASLQRPDQKFLYLRIGQQKTNFRLLPGEIVRTPRILMVAWKGKESIRGNNLFRQVMLNQYCIKKKGKPVIAPICASVNWTESDGSYEKPHLDVIPIYKKLGVEVLWSDMDPNHWYPGDFPGGTGNYHVDPKKYPHGLEPIGDLAKQYKLPFLLWFEPERVAPGTDVDRDHPEFLIKTDPNGHRLFNLADPKALAWMIENLDGFVKRLHLTWLRWDFNFGPLGYWQANDAPDRVGITENHYISGLYKLWDELIKRNPNLVIDLCASGGRRLDIESLHRGVPLWHSDLQCGGSHEAADQLQNAGLWRWMPYHGSGNFGLEPSYQFRSSMTSGNIMAIGGDGGTLATASPALAQAFKNSIKIFKKIRPYMAGDFYPLLPHDASEKAWYGYQFDSPEKGGLFIVFRRKECDSDTCEIALQNIEPEATYDLKLENEVKARKVLGSQLQHLRVKVEQKPGATIVFYKKVI